MAEISTPKEAISQKGIEQGKKPGEVKEAPTKEQTEGRNRSEEIRQKTESNRRFFVAAAGEYPDHAIETDKNPDIEFSGSKEAGEKPVDTDVKPSELKTETPGLGTEASLNNAGDGVKKVEEVKGEKASESKVEALERKKTLTEQLEGEEKRFKSFLYGEPNRKVMEIEGKINKNVYNDRDREIALVKAGKKTLEEYKKGKDLDKAEKKILEEYRDINAQLERYAPGRSPDKYTQNEQRIPSYMIKVDEKGHADYDPFYEPPLIKKVLAAGMGLFSFGESG